MDGLSRKTQSMLSLCMRAGKLPSGDTAVLAAVKNGSAALVIIAADAADNTIKKFSDKCSYYNVPFMIVSDKAQLGVCTGKYNRSVFAVADEGFAKQIAACFETACN